MDTSRISLDQVSHFSIFRRAKRVFQLAPVKLALLFPQKHQIAPGRILFAKFVARSRKFF